MTRREQALLLAQQIVGENRDLDWLKPLAEEFLAMIEAAEDTKQASS